MKFMREKQIEAALVVAAKKRDGLCLKFTSPSMAGVPDRLVILPDNKIAFVELKAPRKKPRPLQRQRIKQLKNLGAKVYVCDNLNQIEVILNAISTP